MNAHSWTTILFPCALGAAPFGIVDVVGLSTIQGTSRAKIVTSIYLRELNRVKRTLRPEEYTIRVQKGPARRYDEGTDNISQKRIEKTNENDES